MEIIKATTNIIKKAKHFIVGDTREKKLDIILDYLIDSIELRGNEVLIKTKKNIAIQNDGHFVQINSGSHVLLSKEIHLNPNITFNDKNLSDIQSQLDYAREIEEQKVLEEQKETAKQCEDIIRN